MRVWRSEALSIQFWYKGTFYDNEKIINLRDQNSDVHFLYLTKYGNTLIIKSGFTGPSINITQSLSPTEWVFIGLSLGWTGFDDYYTIWAYIYQDLTNVEEGACETELYIAPAVLDTNTLLKYEFGPGWDGYLKSFYVSNTLHDYLTFSNFKNTFGNERYNCFDTEFNQEPFYINPGCGNGYLFPFETTEECDDLNHNSGDGWSILWKREPNYACEPTGIARISAWEIHWGNGMQKEL